MNKFRALILLSLFASVTLQGFSGKGGYSIKVKMTGTKDTVCYLANYYGDKQYLKDTAFINKKGLFIFQGDENLQGGIYLIVTQDKNYFEFIVNKEQVLSFETNAGNLVENMKIEGSPENTAFYDYLRLLAKKQKEIKVIQDSFKFAKTHADTVHLQNRITPISKEIFNYKTDFLKKHPDYFITKVFIASKDVEVPEAPLLPDGKKDDKFQYFYYKDHYWDNVDLNDERLLFTPVFHNKLKQFFDDIVIQIPDTIIKEADKLIDKVKNNKELFKYVVWYITNTYERSNYMGFDAVFVYMAENYYMNNKAYWITPSVLENITKRAKRLKNILLGAKAPSLANPDSNERWVFMDTMTCKYTILLFWDSDCGHCKIEIPKLKKYYDENKLKYNFEVYSVCTDAELVRWKKYIRENKLDWINVSGTKSNIDYHDVYDIYSTPVIYLLDRNKKILAKRLDTESLKKYLEQVNKVK